MFNRFIINLFYIFKEPDHERAKLNLGFYTKLINEQLKTIRGDTGKEETESLLNPFEFQNPRPPSVLGYERDSYESLCRNDDLVLKDVQIFIKIEF